MLTSIKPGSLVFINKSESIIDGATLKIIGWFEDKTNKDVNAELFEINTVGMYIGQWSVLSNGLVWHEVMVGSKVYLFTWEQLEPICPISIPEDNSLNFVN